MDVENLADIGGRNIKLRDNEETRDKFRVFGTASLSIAQCAFELGCCRATIFNFFNRAPQARKIYSDAFNAVLRKKEAERLEAARLNAQWKASRKKGEATGKCPVCGTKPKQPQTITIDTATLAEARRKLETLFDKYDARDAQRVSGGDE